MHDSCSAMHPMAIAALSVTALLVWRFVRTSGIKMLSLMGRDPQRCAALLHCRLAFTT